MTDPATTRRVTTKADRLLAEQAFAGDSNAFAAIVQRYERPVYHMCYRYLPGPDAEDLAQETFLRAFVNRERFDPSRPVLPWLLVIAKNLCTDQLRSKRPEKHSKTDISNVRDHLPSAEETVAGTEELKILARGLNGLPDGQRETVAMYHFDGLSYREMADVLDVPVGTVMTWLHRARESLRKLVRKPTGVSVRAKTEK